MQPGMSKNIKLSLVVIVLIVVALLGYWIFNAVTRSGKIAVIVTSVPGDAVITANDTRILPGTVYLKPGNYTFKASKTGFESYSSEKVIEQGSNTPTVSISMAPISDDAKKWASENQQAYFDLEGEAGTQADRDGDAFRAKNPIVELLPTSTLIYTIGYRNDNSDPSGNSIILTVDAAPGFRNGAVQAIKDMGYDPSKFKIEFKDYTNPFAS
jgi:hypothetical protein